MSAVNGVLAAIYGDYQGFRSPEKGGGKGQKVERTAAGDEWLMKIRPDVLPNLPLSGGGVPPLPYFTFSSNRLLLDPPPWLTDLNRLPY